MIEVLKVMIKPVFWKFYIYFVSVRPCLRQVHSAKHRIFFILGWLVNRKYIARLYFWQNWTKKSYAIVSFTRVCVFMDFNLAQSILDIYGMPFADRIWKW